LLDPLTQVAALIRPRAPFSKVVSAVGRWRVSRSEPGQPFYCAILEGSTLLRTDEHEELALEAGDFVLIPAAHQFSMMSVAPPEGSSDSDHIMLPGGEVRIGNRDQTPNFRALVGYCVLESSDTALLLSLLPKIIHVRGDRRLTMLVELVGDEAKAQRPGRDMVLSHLLEVLFVEALRSNAATAASPGLLRALADERIATAIRELHRTPERKWTVEELANQSALSRSAFFDRFQKTVGVSPMEYLLAWRMALAKDLLRRGTSGVADVAEQIGYSSASTFSTAFKRHTGRSPAAFARRAV
jgi:AraC-like DNA-binding protein